MQVAPSWDHERLMDAIEKDDRLLLKLKLKHGLVGEKEAHALTKQLAIDMKNQSQWIAEHKKWLEWENRM